MREWGARPPLTRNGGVVGCDSRCTEQLPISGYRGTRWACGSRSHQWREVGVQGDPERQQPSLGGRYSAS
jgi:hypothetical protein